MDRYAIETYGELVPYISREWLLTNGTGSFSSSTALGCNTRRYHGLLVAAVMPPIGRVMGLSRVAESISIGGQAVPIELSVNYFGEQLLPRGDRYQRKFEFSDIAEFIYEAEGVRVTKQVQLCWGKSVAGVRYIIEPGDHDVRLRLAPFVRMRDFHSLLHRGTDVFDLSNTDEACTIGYHNLRLQIGVSGAKFEARRDWWYGHTYPIETERGLDDREDLFTPGYFEVSVAANTPQIITLWAGLNAEIANLDFDAERETRKARDGIKPRPTPTQNRLVRAANDFLAKRTLPDGSQGSTILAGFPWFADWGRDTMISLPGLLLSTGRHQQAGQVLSVFASYVSEGMIPNNFDDYTNEPSYNTVDASLWFVHAAHEYLRVTRDRDTYDSLLRPACEEIVDGYRDGTRFNIKMDDADGLMSAGDASTQLTWMDAKTAGIAFTPRHGKAVEINALWYNALRYLDRDKLADRVRESFQKTFYISSFRGLADVVNASGVDRAIRPNQIFAVSLPHSPLKPEQQAAVVEVVRRELLTPYGLRTLATSERGYRPDYTGTQFERDGAYHNGAIWPWLIGGFLDAYLKVNKNTPAAREQCRAWLRPLIDHMNRDACLGSISETFEAKPPHRPVACCAQAWSVSEVLRLVVELEM